MYLGEDDGRTTQQRAEEDYRTKLGYSRKLHGPASLGYEVDAQVMLGQNIMREETGFFGPWEGPRYNLDKATQDLLIAHTRQDAAATHGLASAALRQAFRARRMVWHRRPSDRPSAPGAWPRWCSGSSPSCSC